MKGFLVIFMLSLVILPAGVSAHDEMDPRHVAMTTLGNHMKSISRGLKAGQITPEMREMAGEIKSIAEKLTDLFPKGTEKANSRAKPEIWTDFAGFQEAGKRFLDATIGLNEALQSNDISAAQTAQKETGKKCGGCHKAYRLPKK